jgi:MFS family permease
VAGVTGNGAADDATSVSAAAAGGGNRRRSAPFGQTLAVVSDRNFYPYLIGNMLSSVGTWFQTLGQAILIYRLTDSTILLGVIGFAQYGGVVVLAPWTGSVADRFDRRQVLIISQVAATIVTAILTVVVAAGRATPLLLIVFALVLSVANAFWTPTMMAFVPSLVPPERLSTALALNSVTFNVGRAIGPLLAALVIDSVGVAWAFGINACSYAAVVLGVLSVRALAPRVRPDQRPLLRESIRLVLADRRLLVLLCAIAAMNLATDPVITLGPAFASRVFHRADSFSGFLVGAFGVGAVIAAFTIAYRLRGSARAIAMGLACTGIGAAGFALAPTAEVGLGLLLILGFGYLSTNTATTTRLHLEVSDAHRGRIMTLWAIAFNGVRPIGSLVDGVIAAAGGVRAAGVVMAVPALALSAMIIRKTRTRSAG